MQDEDMAPAPSKLRPFFPSRADVYRFKILKDQHPVASYTLWPRSTSWRARLEGWLARIKINR